MIFVGGEGNALVSGQLPYGELLLLRVRGEIEKEIRGCFSLFGLHNEEQTICFRCVIACIGVSKRTRDNADEQRDTKECG